MLCFSGSGSGGPSTESDKEASAEKSDSTQLTTLWKVEHAALLCWDELRRSHSSHAQPGMHEVSQADRRRS